MGGAFIIMIGLGKWSLDIQLPFLKVQPVLTISDNDGKYGFTIDSNGFGLTPAINLVSVSESENSLIVKHQIPMLSAGDLEARLTFEGSYLRGEMEIPMVGKITFKGVKVG